MFQVLQRITLLSHDQKVLMMQKVLDNIKMNTVSDGSVVMDPIQSMRINLEPLIVRLKIETMAYCL